MRTKVLGRNIVADSAICHGKPTFCGTRILVADVLEQVASTWLGRRLSKNGVEH